MLLAAELNDSLASSASRRTLCLCPLWLCTAGRGRSAGSSNTAGAPPRVLLPILELTGRYFAGERFALPGCEIAVLDRKSGNFWQAIRMERVIKPRHLLEQHTDRPAIHNNVMHGQNQDVLCGRQAQESDTNEWAGTQIKWTLPFFRGNKQRVLFLLVFGQVFEADERQLGGLRSDATNAITWPSTA